jgi:hypothetical protein
MHRFFAIALTMTALQGHWIAARYADALASMRSPSRGEKREEERVGFRWENGKLMLYKVIEDPHGCPISCEKAPFAVLQPY